MKKLFKKILCLLGFHSIPKVNLIDWHMEQEMKGYKHYGHQVYMDFKRIGCKWCFHTEIEKRFYIGNKIDVPLNEYMTYKKLVDKTSLEDVIFYYKNCV